MPRCNAGAKILGLYELFLPWFLAFVELKKNIKERVGL